MLKSLNKLSEEDKDLVIELASLYFIPEEIAVMLEADPTEANECYHSGSGDFYNSFQKGRLQSEVELRKSIMMLAKAGSSPAQSMAMDLLKKSKSKMLG